MTNIYKYNDINAIKAWLRRVPHLQLLKRKIHQIKAKRPNHMPSGSNTITLSFTNWNFKVHLITQWSAFSGGPWTRTRDRTTRTLTKVKWYQNTGNGMGSVRTQHARLMQCSSRITTSKSVRNSPIITTLFTSFDKT